MSELTKRAALFIASAAIAFLVVPVSMGQADTVRNVNKLMDSTDMGYEYAYAPSIIYESGTFHMFFCSSGAPAEGWDRVRYATSPDGRQWSAPSIVLRASSLANETAACDPSVVRYQAPGDSQPYYYLFYSGNPNNTGTAMYVARSAAIGGPYAKWVGGSSWVVNGANPEPIITSTNPVDVDLDVNDPRRYGAGQQTVVVKDGELHSWFVDSTCGSGCLLMHSYTDDPTDWPAGTDLGMNSGSVDVKYDPNSDTFEMFDIEADHTATASLVRRSSSDGISWSSASTLCSAACFMDYAHNVGVSGSNAGGLISNRALIVYGGGDAACGNCWGHWDLYGMALNPAGDVWNGVPWGWEWHGMRSGHKLVLGDYDGDGMTDRAIVDQSYIGATNARWYAIPSSGVEPFPWNWEWSGMGPLAKPVVGDYDGDGKTDRAYVSQFDSMNARWYIQPSSGIWPFPQGWNWAGMRSGHKVVPADYDGDGKTDRAIVDQATYVSTVDSSWYGVFSSGVSQFPWGWQWTGMKPNHKIISGDFDGDGKDDRAIVDQAYLGATNARWYVVPSSGVYPFPFGWSWTGMDSSARPAIGDFDGDGKADRAFVKNVSPSVTSWHIVPSSGNYPFPSGWQWPGMTSSARLALGDYDGDGKTDRAMILQSAADVAKWFVLPSKPFRIY